MSARARRRIAFEVFGLPRPQGSAKAFVPWKWAKEAVRRGKAPRAIIVHDSPGLKAWRDLVADSAPEVQVLEGPVVLTVTFHLARPLAVGTLQQPHVSKPDLDKLTRAVGDALEGVLYANDSQIVDLHARKVYTPIAGHPGAKIVVEEAETLLPDQLDLLADGAVFS